MFSSLICPRIYLCAKWAFDPGLRPLLVCGGLRPFQLAERVFDPWRTCGKNIRGLFSEKEWNQKTDNVQGYRYLPFRRFCIFFFIFFAPVGRLRPGKWTSASCSFFRGRGEQKDESDRKHSSLPFNLLLSLLFFQEKEKQKEKKKRRYSLSSSPLFSFLFFFKKGKKAGEKEGGCNQEFLFSAIFVLFFVLKRAKEKQREENFFWLFFAFLRNKKRRKGEARHLAGRLSPPVRSEKLCKKEIKKMRCGCRRQETCLMQENVAGCMSRTGPCFLNSLALPFKNNMPKKEEKVLGKKIFLDFF